MKYRDTGMDNNCKARPFPYFEYSNTKLEIQYCSKVRRILFIKYRNRDTK